MNRRYLSLLFCSWMRFRLSQDFVEQLDNYFTEGSFSELLLRLKKMPTAGTVIPGYSGIRKLRAPDSLRRIGSRYGLRIIYRHIPKEDMIVLYLAYRKSDQTDILPHQRALFFDDYFEKFSGDVWM